MLNPNLYSCEAMRVALLVAFNGAAFSGNAFQPSGGLTVEGALVDGLKKLGYLGTGDTIKDIDLERTGRTDAGVSAECMVYTVRLSKSVSESPCLSVHGHRAISGLEGSPLESNSIYTSESGPSTCLAFHLNRVLPSQVRVLGVMAPIPESFSARHSCIAREYEYILGYNVSPDQCEKANLAAHYYLGSHSFHSFCYHEKDREVVYTRQIYCSEVYTRDDVCIFHVIGSAFLYHQVRYMASILVHIMAGLEKESVIKYLLTREISKPKRSFPLVPSQYLTFKCGWYPPQFSNRSFYCSIKAYEELTRHVLVNTSFKRSALGHQFAKMSIPVLHVLNISKKDAYKSLEQSSGSDDNNSNNNTMKAVKN